MDLSLQLNQMKFVKGTDFRQNLIDNGHLGQGNNRVYSVIVGGKQYALKQVIIHQCSIENEIKIMQSLSNSPYVINLIDYMILETISADKYTQNQQLAYLLMEKGVMNLDQHIRDKKHYLPNEELHTLLEQLISIFEYLQQKNIAHRDIKLENILVMQPFSLKACDVGCSSHIETSQTISVVGTKSYLAPELLNAESTKLKHNPFKSDVYSLGLCYLYLVTLQHWSERQKVNAQIEEEIIKDYLKHVIRITAHDTIIVVMLKYMLTINPESRPDFIELKAKFNQLKDEQTKSVRLTLDSFDSPKKSISQYDYLSPELSASNRGRNTGSNFYQQERQKSAKNLSNTKKQPSQTNLFFETSRKRPSKSPKHSSPSHNQFIDKFTKPPSANPKLAQTKANSYKVPQSASNQQPQQQQRVMSKFHQSVVDNKKMYTEFSQTMPMPEIQTFAPIELKSTDDLIECEYDEICRLYQHEQFVSLYQGRYSKKCALPASCKYLNLKLNNQSPAFYLEPINDIQILVLEIIDDTKDAGQLKWSDNITNLQFCALTQVEIIVTTKVSQANNIIAFLNKIENVPKVTISIQSDLTEQDHRTIVWRLSKYNCVSFTFNIPKVKLIYTQISQLWHFNKSLDELQLDYEDCDLAPAFSLLTAALRTVEFKRFHFNFSKSQSKNAEISLFLEYLGAKHLLKDLTLIMDQLVNYDKLVQEKLKNNIGKLKNLDRIYLSLVGNQVYIEFFERLFNIFCSMDQLKLIILKFDRCFEKEQLRQTKQMFKTLDTFTLQFFGTTKTLTLIMHNNGLQKRQDYGVTKCNQGKQIKSSQMYICIKCSKAHSFFLKHAFQICSTCVTSCHSQCIPAGPATIETPTNTIGSDSLAQSQIIQNVIRKSHTFIESFNTRDYRCHCYLLGNCNQVLQTKDRNKHQIQWKCTFCNKILCWQCSHDCHSGHTVKEMYINRFKCDCECDKHM